MSGGRWSDRSDRGAGRGGRRNAPRDAPKRTDAPPKRTDASGATAETRKAGAADRDMYLYDRKRAQQARARARLERASFDPAPADPDAEWTVADDNETGLARTPAPAPIGEALQQFLSRRGWGERLTGATASQRWDEVVGPDLAARCEPVRLAGGTLVVRAESQAWATQLRYLLPQLVANANEVLGGHQVREVRLVVGSLEGHGQV
ncbi:MAG: DUF721 domain-containing protein [Nitriliruptor sp.]|uniref:DUF721 domain-containing protein n=1 Tax=Nitriliruptor sp. TaxID=2448056 RepID=UPI0034A0476B